MHYFHSPSYRSNFSRQIFNTCPICAGISLHEYKQAALPTLTICSTHRHAMTNLKIAKVKQEEQARIDQREANDLDKILDPEKNLKRKQKLQEIKQQLIKEVA
jgi:hypothetical protein